MMLDSNSPVLDYTSSDSARRTTHLPPYFKLHNTCSIHGLYIYRSSSQPHINISKWF